MRTIGYIYKYRDSGKWTEEILKTNSLYFGRAKDFNDPLDTDLAIDLSLSANKEQEIVAEAALANGISPAEALRRLANLTPAAKKEWKEKIHAFIDQLRQETSLCCFATSPDNSAMYAHYSENHKGVCLQFSPDARAAFGVPLMVDYGDNPPELRYSELRNRFDGALTKAMFLWKQKKWEYEDEWRVIRLKTPPGPVAFPPGFLTGLFFGCRASDETIERMRECLKIGGANPFLYRMVPNREKGVLEAVRL